MDQSYQYNIINELDPKREQLYR